MAPARVVCGQEMLHCEWIERHGLPTLRGRFHRLNAARRGADNKRVDGSFDGRG
jgi:hypothetical protein